MIITRKLSPIHPGGWNVKSAHWKWSDKKELQAYYGSPTKETIRRFGTSISPRWKTGANFC